MKGEHLEGYLADRRVIVRRLALILKKASLVSVQWAKFMIEVPLNRKIVLISWQFILQMREKKTEGRWR